MAEVTVAKTGMFFLAATGGQSVYFGKLALGIPDTLEYFLVSCVTTVSCCENKKNVLQAHMNHTLFCSEHNKSEHLLRLLCARKRSKTKRQTTYFNVAFLKYHFCIFLLSNFFVFVAFQNLGDL